MPAEKSIDEDKAIAEIVERLQERFPALSPETVTTVVNETRASFEGSKVRDFVPVLIEKEAKKRLKHTA
jgi:anti-sigma-K factor RskA